MTPQQWMDRINAIPRDASVEEQTQQFDAALGELLDAWPVSELTDEEYEADLRVLAEHGIRGQSEQFAEYLLSVSEYRALWVVPMCMAWALRDRDDGTPLATRPKVSGPHELKNYPRFFKGWGQAQMRASRMARKRGKE